MGPSDMAFPAGFSLVTGGGQGVPDGGATVILLGAGLARWYGPALLKDLASKASRSSQSWKKQSGCS